MILQDDITGQKEKEADELKILRIRETLPVHEADYPKSLSWKMPLFEENRFDLEHF